MPFQSFTLTAGRLLAAAGLALSMAVLPPVGPSFAAEAARPPSAHLLPIVAVETGALPRADVSLDTTAADRGKISAALEQWQQAWSREASRKQFGELEQLYIAGEALRSLALAHGFKGWQVAWMNVERIQVAGDSAVSSSIVLRQGDGGYRVLHTWRRENGVWRILNEMILAPT